MSESDFRKRTVVGVFPPNSPVIRASDVHRFVFNQLGLKIEDVEVLQLDPGIRRFFVKLRSEAKFKTILQTNFYEFQCEWKKIEITLSDAGGIGGKILRIFRLPFELSNDDVIAALAPYGAIESITMEKWTNYEMKGVYNGIRGVRMNLKKHVPSYLNIRGIESLILYDGQPRTCRKCHKEGHLFHECTERTANRRRWETVGRGDVTATAAVDKQPPANNNNKPAAQPAGSLPSAPSGWPVLGCENDPSLSNNNSNNNNEPAPQPAAAAAQPSTSHAEQPAPSSNKNNNNTSPTAVIQKLVDAVREKEEGWTPVGPKTKRAKKNNKQSPAAPAPATKQKPDDVAGDASEAPSTPERQPPLTEKQQELLATILNFEDARRGNVTAELCAEIEDHVRAGKRCADWYDLKEADTSVEEMCRVRLAPLSPENYKRKEISPSSYQVYEVDDEDDDYIGLEEEDFSLFG